MAKLLFMPFSIATGLLAGQLSKKAFAAIWSKVDDREPPQPKNQQAGFAKLAFALALEGALFRLVKGLVDNGSRRGFASVTGAWPGDRESQPESE
jgi:hypothetical protein